MTTPGWQTLDLAHDDEKAVTVLLSCIEACVQQYLEARRSIPPSLPLQAAGGLGLLPWGTVLGAQGHQVSHVHPDGWHSGVYMPFRLVSIMTRRRRTETVGLSSGEAKRIRSRSRPETKTFEPIEGHLYLFPSYFYHRTIPFESDEKRVSLAFDLMPRA